MSIFPFNLHPNKIVKNLNNIGKFESGRKTIKLDVVDSFKENIIQG